MAWIKRSSAATDLTWIEGSHAAECPALPPSSPEGRRVGGPEEEEEAGAASWWLLLGEEERRGHNSGCSGRGERRQEAEAAGRAS
ncbi:hypothetical protein PR202_gb11583 [Eleusine coracana subsp. coracana]|uniref:Uncharacterized protein n=1 Tax=Eleusine coracana subsp. coracana TaxID=191504 RepID=A0AAV5EMV6_ELECO|nr:hypothetical protein PR202_gb11583 [Eleusine coracana subsp. coracana]